MLTKRRTEKNDTMPEVNSFASRVKNKLRRSLWTKLLLAAWLLILIGYFVVTSSAFVTGVILPRVSRALHATITVGHASISPFSKLVLSDVKILTTGTEPLISAQELRVRYDGWNLFHGKINVSELLLVSPSVQLVYHADGTCNLDPLLSAGGKSSAARGPEP